MIKAMMMILMIKAMMMVFMIKAMRNHDDKSNDDATDDERDNDIKNDDENDDKNDDIYIYLFRLPHLLMLNQTALTHSNRRQPTLSRPTDPPKRISRAHHSHLNRYPGVFLDLRIHLKDIQGP